MKKIFMQVWLVAVISIFAVGTGKNIYDKFFPAGNKSCQAEVKVSPRHNVAVVVYNSDTGKLEFVVLNPSSEVKIGPDREKIILSDDPAFNRDEFIKHPEDFVEYQSKFVAVKSWLKIDEIDTFRLFKGTQIAVKNPTGINLLKFNQKVVLPAGELIRSLSWQTIYYKDESRRVQVCEVIEATSPNKGIIFIVDRLESMQQEHDIQFFRCVCSSVEWNLKLIAEKIKPREDAEKEKIAQAIAEAGIK